MIRTKTILGIGLFASAFLMETGCTQQDMEAATAIATAFAQLPPVPIQYGSTYYTDPGPTYNYNNGYAPANAECSECVYSDYRLKVNVVELNQSFYGLPLYSFEYISVLGAPGRFTGLMAQDVIESPFSVFVHVSPAGFLMVDYNGLVEC